MFKRILSTLILFTMTLLVAYQTSMYTKEKEVKASDYECCSTPSSSLTAGVVKEVSNVEQEAMQSATVEETEVEEVSAEPVDLFPEGMYNETYTLKDVQLLAACVFAEAGACSDKHQEYVACVILNRVKSDKFPNTIEEVIYQNKPLQYQCTVNGALRKYLSIYNNEVTDIPDYEFDAYERCFENVAYVITTGSENFMPDSVVFQAEFEQGSGCYEQLDNTYFCYQ